MHVLIDKPLSLRNRLLVIATSWCMGDFKNTIRVLLFGRTGPFPDALRSREGSDG